MSKAHSQNCALQLERLLSKAEGVLIACKMRIMLPWLNPTFVKSCRVLYLANTIIEVSFICYSDWVVCNRAHILQFMNQFGHSVLSTYYLVKHLNNMIGGTASSQKD